MRKLKSICKKIVDFAPLVLGGGLGIIIALSLVGVLDLGITFATIGAFFGKFVLWVIGIAIAIIVVACFFPSVLIVLIAAVVILILILLITLIGAVL